MTAATAVGDRSPARKISAATAIWIGFAALAMVSFALPDGTIPAWMREVPPQWRLGLDTAISNSMKWLVNDATFGLFTFREATRAISDLLDAPLTAATAIFSTGLLRGSGSTAVQLAPPLPWIAVVGIAAALGYRFGGARLALLAAGAFLYLAVFGQWASAMTTLAAIAIAVPLGVAGGMLFGILGFSVPLARRVMEPILDVMQTVPIFAYLIPILFLFGFGPVSALIATMIYAMPPMVRVTMTALEAVPREIVEYGTMAGTTRRQMLFKVMLPAARPQLLVGVNQVIMLSLNMVIIASMIGAGGLGYDVLTSLRRLDIGRGFEAGIAIVVLAIALDRLSQAYASRRRTARSDGRGFALGLLGFTLAIYMLGLFVPAIATYPQSLEVSTAPWWGEAVRWFNINFFDAMDAIKSALLLNVLIPVKRFMVAQTWLLVTAALAFAGWRLGGTRLALLAGGLSLFIALNGLWEKAMVSVYLVGISVIVASAIGIPLGIWGGLSSRAWRVIEAVIDTLQTLPSFVYLIPVVMLFRVGDFTAMIAIVLYALAPAVRYTAHGIRGVQPTLVEAGTAAGCTPSQLLTKIRLPLATPIILLGVNQTVMLALSMLVITALVGTRDLGQEVYIALTKADVGRGLVAGLCVAAIAIIADRLIQTAARRLAAQRGERTREP
ncbi:MAG: ABC transporter permease [Methyloceanibacter sp.]|uniref:ABC transporter permease n=1 Tax=Methyloceanibacter sp. TaxID=1965321 RepID=UPI003D6D23D3